MNIYCSFEVPLYCTSTPKCLNAQYLCMVFNCMHVLNHSCSFLAKRGVKDEICSFDARKITPEIRASVQELLDKNANSFDAKVIDWLTLMINLSEPTSSTSHVLIFSCRWQNVPAPQPPPWHRG